MPVRDWVSGGKQRRLRRDIEFLESRFGGTTPVNGAELDRAARTYGRALRAALQLDPPQAAHVFGAVDARIPDDHYERAFGTSDERWLAGLAARDDQHVLAVVFELATRLRLTAVQRATRDRLVGVLGRGHDTNLLVTRLRRWMELGLLDRDTLSRALTVHVSHTPLRLDAQLWSRFFAQLPEPSLPDMFEVYAFLGRGADAVRLADTPARQQEALDVCARSARWRDVEAGLELARRLADAPATRRVEERAGDLLVEADRLREAVPHYRAAGRSDRVSECHERLGEFFDAFAACPTDQPDRLAHLAAVCQPEIDALVERREFVIAARQVQGLLTRLTDADPATASVSARRSEVAGQRDALVIAGRAHFGTLVKRAEPGGDQAVREAWSRFEEAAGEWAAAARRAQEAGDVYRAYRLYHRSGQFGDADRVLRGDGTVEGLNARAIAREAGADLAGAALLYEEAGQWEQAVDLFMRAGEFAAAARALVRWRADDAIEDSRYADCLRRTGDLEELVRRCLVAVDRRGAETRAVDELRRLVADPALPPVRRAEARATLEAQDAEARRPFEIRAQAWVEQARAETDRRFAGIWGLDLGTTTCAAAIYDSQTRQVVLCPWKGQVQFASTLSLDRRGNEVIGLIGEEILASWVVGHIEGAKRRIGTSTVYRIRDRSYRPEEVAARLIRYARGMVESFLAAQVRERVGELARVELGELRDEWLSWADLHHDLRLDRPRVVLTIPAYFMNNQKHATRDACRIAGVEVVRLIHEPTAACITAARERTITGRVVVVDLGAGTLDLSLLEVDDALYDVQKVMGDNHFGGKDLDAAVRQEIAARLERQGIAVPKAGVSRRRLEIAAEHLKVALSGQIHVQYEMRGFADRKDVRLELERSDLAAILAGPLSTLRRACTEFHASLAEKPDHLVLVGGPMLSPLVREMVEDVFGLRRIALPDPRTAAACGAALQAAVLDGKLKELLLLDVTPLSLGVRVVDEKEREELSVIVEGNTHIPVERHNTYTTRNDDQTAVEIEIFNGQLAPEAKIGQFRLEGIPPAPRGTPKIEVTFFIDASCVLEVTARDLGSGKSNSIRISDTTLLSPREVEEMARGHRRQQERERLLQRLVALVAEAEESDGEASWREFRSRLDGYRPSGTPLDAETQQVLAEMFRAAHQMEVDLLLAQGPLPDLVAKAREHLDTTGADESTTKHLVDQLDEQLRRLRQLLADLARWNAVLVRLAVAGPDPLRRFRGHHDAGAYARALEAIDALTSTLDDPADVRRLLHCHARMADAEAYRAVLARYAPLLGATLMDPSRPDAFLPHARAAQAQVTARRVAGDTLERSGFLVHERLVVTNRHHLVERAHAERPTIDPRDIVVRLDGGTRQVADVLLPDSGLLDVALLRLSEPVAAKPFHLGHPRLVRIGDRIWTPTPDRVALTSGVVDQFEAFPEEGLNVLKTSLQAPAECSGGPLLNDLGEVVGILTTKEGADRAFAITVDALHHWREEIGGSPFLM
jgi:molecular chaperone DnaK